MIKTIEMGEKKITFSTNFAWCFIYKSQFGKDPAKVIMPVVSEMNGEERDGEEFSAKIYETFGFIEIANIAWAMAKLADRSISEPMEWVMEIGDDFDLNRIMTDLIPEAIQSCLVSKKSMAPIQKEA